MERIKTKTKASPAAPKLAPATAGDIKLAIEALTREDTERIRRNAENRIFWVGPRAANGRNADDLTEEALERILGGKRRWYKERVGFASYLIGVIWSIASEWAGYRERNKDRKLDFAPLESELTKTDEDGNDVSPFDGVATRELSPDQALVEAELRAAREAHSKAFMEKVEAKFADDVTASMVIAGIIDDMSGPEIRTTLELSEKDFKATMRRIERYIKKITEQPNGGQGA